MLFLLKVLPLGKPVNGQMLSEKYVHFPFVNSKRPISCMLDIVGTTRKYLTVKGYLPQKKQFQKCLYSCIISIRLVIAYQNYETTGNV